MITLEDFDKLDLRVGKIIDASINKGARNPAYKLKIDFGPIEIKKSSAQITDLYEPKDLINRQVIAVMNFKPIHISEVTSEVRILGAETSKGIVLLNADEEVENGSKIS